jgi:hypothetical protein
MDVPEAMTPFLEQAWNNLQADQQRLDKAIRNQRIINLVMLAATLFYLGMIVGEVLEHV